MASAPPLKITVAPAPPSTSANALATFFTKYPALKQYSKVIIQWSRAYGAPPEWVAAIIQFEGGFNPKTGQPNNVTNSEGTGFGLAQINPKAWFGKVFPPTGDVITAKWASQPGNAIQFAAYLVGQSAGQYGSLSELYSHVYNPGYTGNPKTDPESLGPAKLIPETAAQAASTSGLRGNTPVEKAAASAASTESKAASPAQQVLTARAKYDSIYLAYTGKTANAADLEALIKNPISTYQLELNLADPMKNKGLFNSPIWQTHAPTYQAYYQKLYGPTAKAPQAAILYGVVHNLDENAFESMIRTDSIPGAAPYTTSEDYKTQFAQFQQSYAGIYGLPDATGSAAIKQAILKGWSQAQFENYLRAQPEYTSSGEYKERATSLAQQFGLITGASQQTALGTGKPIVPPTPVTPPVPALPASPNASEDFSDASSNGPLNTKG